MPVIRAFIAVDLPETVQQKVEQLQQELRKTQALVSWVKPASIHITLKFLGNIFPEQVPGIQSALEGIALNTSVFRLQPKGCGAFPSLKQMRIVWIGLHGNNEPLGELQQEVESAIIKLGFKAEDRPFRPHLTIGRVKGKRGLRSLQDALLAQNTFETEAFDVKEVVLYKSELRREGALYTPLFCAKFAHSAE